MKCGSLAEDCRVANKTGSEGKCGRGVRDECEVTGEGCVTVEGM